MKNNLLAETIISVDPDLEASLNGLERIFLNYHIAYSVPTASDQLIGSKNIKTLYIPNLKKATDIVASPPFTAYVSQIKSGNCYIIADGADNSVEKLIKKLGCNPLLQQSLSNSKESAPASFIVSGYCGERTALVGPTASKSTHQVSQAKATALVWSEKMNLPDEVLDLARSTLNQLLQKKFSGQILMEIASEQGVWKLIRSYTDRFLLNTISQLQVNQRHWPLSSYKLLEAAGVTLPNPQPLEASILLINTSRDLSKLHVARGRYRLQSDNSAREWQTMDLKENVVYLDEERDKPAILQDHHYTLHNNSGFYFETKGHQATLIFPYPLAIKQQLPPWIEELIAKLSD